MVQRVRELATKILVLGVRKGIIRTLDIQQPDYFVAILVQMKQGRTRTIEQG